MNRRRIALIAAAFMLPALLALTYLGRTYVTVIGFSPFGATQSTTYRENDNGDTYEYYTCTGSPCTITRLCGGCHVNGEDKSKEVYTVAQHLKLYYPKFATTLSEGQKLSLNESGAYLTSEGGLFKAYYKAGALAMVASTGSLLLRDGSGLPGFLYVPLKPTLYPPPR